MLRARQFPRLLLGGFQRRLSTDTPFPPRSLSQSWLRHSFRRASNSTMSASRERSLCIESRLDLLAHVSRNLSPAAAPVWHPPAPASARVPAPACCAPVLVRPRAVARRFRSAFISAMLISDCFAHTGHPDPNPLTMRLISLNFTIIAQHWVNLLPTSTRCKWRPTHSIPLLAPRYCYNQRRQSDFSKRRKQASFDEPRNQHRLSNGQAGGVNTLRWRSW